MPTSLPLRVGSWRAFFRARGVRPFARTPDWRANEPRLQPRIKKCINWLAYRCLAVGDRYVLKLATWASMTS